VARVRLEGTTESSNRSEPIRHFPNQNVRLLEEPRELTLSQAEGRSSRCSGTDGADSPSARLPPVESKVVFDFAKTIGRR